MLKKRTCEDFRARFEPRGPRSGELASHRRECVACAAWADRLESATAAGAPVPLPATLRRRLVAIPAAALPAVACHEVKRLYESTWHAAHGGEPDPAVEAHLEGCGRCARIYGTLRGAMTALRVTLPEALRTRLAAIAEPRRPPLWIRDGGFAVAASALLTASLVFLMGDGTSLWRSAGETVTSRSTVWAERGASQGQAVWETLAETVATGLERGREAAVVQGDAYRDLWHDAASLYQQTRSRLLAERDLEGEDDGQP